jgi:hypothetical protein
MCEAGETKAVSAAAISFRKGYRNMMTSHSKGHVVMDAVLAKKRLASASQSAKLSIAIPCC